MPLSSVPRALPTGMYSMCDWACKATRAGRWEDKGGGVEGAMLQGRGWLGLHTSHSPSHHVLAALAMVALLLHHIRHAVAQPPRRLQARTAGTCARPRSQTSVEPKFTRTK